MIFALYNYYHYKNRSGCYGRDLRNGPMSSAWENGIPDFVLNELEDGDILFFQTFNSISAWLIVYGTSSQVSHVGFYLKEKRIGHMVPPELTIEPIQNCFKENIRILPVKIGNAAIKEGKKFNVESFLEEIENKNYGYKTVFIKALKILSGRHWYYFRWKFFGDISLLLLILDSPFLLFLNQPIFSFLIPVHFALILFNSVLWKYKPLGPDADNGAPVDGFRFVQAAGGMILGDAYAIRNQNHKLPIYRHISQQNRSLSG